ncbi:hypothetical protein ETAA8_53220 [Anatilimnocola aggregata]|uniref:Uncharacterized protein n=1 Tax=Anatilimnocola aggregata TaxID=2528021 RepID=A0A517YIZ7_9BACT|nr:hypothetical protein [Anatilimnocola aggregata]QDU30203.1 hypothetical protein ETAA8_53220 [Anatilimnocola aggregata]
MLHYRNQSHLRARTRRGVSWLLRCLLLVVAWQGPLPWCHAHGTLGNCSEVANCSLQEHLRSHHPGTNLFGDIFFSWHVHVDLPQPGSESEESDETELPRTPAVESIDLVGHALSRAWESSNPIAVDADCECHDLNCGRQVHSACSQHFLANFATSLPLPLRFCVARC